MGGVNQTMPLSRVPVLDRFFSHNPNADIIEKTTWSVCRLSTIVSCVAIGAMAGMAIPAIVAGVGIGSVAFITFSLGVRLIKLTKDDPVEKKTLAALAAAVFFIGGVAIGLSGLVFLSTMIHQIAMIALTVGLGYFGGDIAYKGIKLIKEELQKDPIDPWKVAGVSALTVFGCALGKPAYVLLGASPLMAIAVLAIALSVISNELLADLRRRAVVPIPLAGMFAL